MSEPYTYPNINDQPIQLVNEDGLNDPSWDLQSSPTYDGIMIQHQSTSLNPVFYGTDTFLLFSRSSAWKRHKQNLEISCPICGNQNLDKAFNRRDHLRQHFRVFHKLGRTTLNYYASPRISPSVPSSTPNFTGCGCRRCTIPGCH